MNLAAAKGTVESKSLAREKKRSVGSGRNGRKGCCWSVDLRAVFKSSAFRPRKSLGQNFLIDRDVGKTIVGFAAATRKDTVLEVGAGVGFLTEILARTAGRVIAVEFDRRLVAIMRERLRGNKRIEIVAGDILEVDLKALLECEGGRASPGAILVGNIPYQLTGRIFSQVLGNKELWSRAVLMVQREVASRLRAGAGSKSYGILSVLAQYDFCIEESLPVGKESFYPQPKVESALLRIGIRKKPSVEVKDPEFFFFVVRKAFGQRRKMLVNSLGGEGAPDKGELRRALESSGIKPGRRAETVTVEEFAALSDQLLSVWRM